MKTMLIFPNLFFGHYLQGEVPNHPSLAIGSLAAILREKGHDVSVIDASAEKLSVSRLVTRVDKIKPDIIGITTNIGFFDKSLYTARVLRERFRDIPIIMGGPWASIEFERVLKGGYASVVVIGEGERTLPELLENLHQHNNWHSIDGIAYLDDEGRIKKTKQRELITDLDSLPFPAWDLFPSSKHYKFMQRGSPFFPIMTSRGCPYDCIHCTKIVHGYNYRTRSVENVIAELRFLKARFNAREIFIIDDVFNLDMTRTKKIMDCIIDGNFHLNINFTNGIRADKLDEVLAYKFKKAGVYSAALGIESGNQDIVNKIGKKLDLTKVVTAVKLLKKYKIGARGFFILGHPHDTFETMLQTLRFAKKLDLDYPHFFKSIPFHGTKMYDIIKAEGTFHKSIAPSAMDTYNMRAFSFDVWNLHAQDVEKAFDLSYRLFYLRPRKILQLVSSIRSRSEFWWVFRSFMNIIIRNIF